jgi:hypothetical protein
MAKKKKWKLLKSGRIRLSSGLLLTRQASLYIISLAEQNDVTLGKQIDNLGDANIEIIITRGSRILWAYFRAWEDILNGLPYHVKFYILGQRVKKNSFYIFCTDLYNASIEKARETDMILEYDFKFDYINRRLCLSRLVLQYADKMTVLFSDALPELY